MFLYKLYHKANILGKIKNVDLKSDFEKVSTTYIGFKGELNDAYRI